jgi:diadenosine tetraphosphate (Ap4A) HIT family hydrolase
MAHLTCPLCASRAALWEDDRWYVRHIEAPWGVAGWMMLVSKRHIAGAAAMDDDEARSYGVVLRRCTRVLADVTGALRIYTAALGEAVPHFHTHMVPRLPDGPRGWSVYDQQRAAAAGEIVVAAEDVTRIAAAYAAALG